MRFLIRSCFRPLIGRAVATSRVRVKRSVGDRFRLIALFLGVLTVLVTSVAGAQGWSLDSCLSVAEARNPDLKAAEHDIVAARARIHQARAFEPPLFSIEAGKLGTAVSRDEREQSWRLTQALPLPAQRGRGGAVASLDAELVGLDRESARLRIRGDVTRTYRRLQADILTLHVLRSLEGTARSIEEMTDVRLGTGAARYLDVLRARVELARLGNDLVDVHRSLGEHRRALNVLMARDGEAPLEPTDSLAFVPLADSLSTVLAHALRTRPRLRAAQLQIQREQLGRSLAQGNLLPTPEIGIGLDRVPGSSRLGVGTSLSLSMPFVPWTDRRARIAESGARVGSAQSRHEAAERSLESSVRSAYDAARATEEQVAVFERVLLRDAADAVRSATRGYQYGQIDGTDLFESLRTVRTVQLEYIRALLNYELALVELQTAE